MMVTTSYEPTEGLVEQAVRLAEAMNAAYGDRKKLSVSRLHAVDEDVLVVTSNGLKAYKKGYADPFFFHPDMAMLRIKRLINGDNDLMVTACGLEPGMTFLDCTLGMGSDALVASFVTGACGRVVGIESEPILACVVESGLAEYHSGNENINQAMRRIEVVCRNHLTFLQGCENNKFDVVYFDPMFHAPIMQSASFAPLRPFANYARLASDVVEEAKRVAALRVVMKNHSGSPDFERLGFNRVNRLGRSFTYGVIEIGGAQPC
ncbi:class I SAM-dependent methyltransferase [Aneurinibacillus sp. Ricciae_BoGa-3]|uniref:class I SAM-dependent methyltransferase n=1 Tax=Aneurinibacillus sp. Ricciae_BoGa-3 TaxID=3022697 RepID=UPI00233FCD2C|nr:class I SAM-dependent methyltransferase [Aneurinibacillus sp. Ricciae_BoGa-3]WCK52403.1 class I SAM-dependent methyltransferase [Aneurinibacillus sp. Ricciae_BoGa-3]